MAKRGVRLFLAAALLSGSAAATEAPDPGAEAVVETVQELSGREALLAAAVVTRARLETADALAQQQRWEEVPALLLDPLDAFFSGTAMRLDELLLEGMDADLQTLAERATDPATRADFSTELEEPAMRLDRAIKGTVLAGPSELAEVVSALLRAVDHRYSAAYEAGSPSTVGLLEASAIAGGTARLLDSHAPAMRAQDADTFELVRADLQRVVQLTDQAEPTQEPPIAPAELSALVASIASKLGRF